MTQMEWVDQSLRLGSSCFDVEDKRGRVPEMGTYGGWMSIAGNGPMDCGVVPESTSGWELRERAGRAMLSL